MPAILTGAGGIALFATIYAAHALYGFIGPAAAFVLLTAAGLVTLFLSVIHGPGLAALGALGSYVAPLLVSSAEPAPFPVVLHTLAVTAAVLGMARIRGWQWLAVGGIVGSLALGACCSARSIAPTTTPAELLLVAGLVVALRRRVPVRCAADEPPRPQARTFRADRARRRCRRCRSTTRYGDPLYPPLVCRHRACRRARRGREPLDRRRACRAHRRRRSPSRPSC